MANLLSHPMEIQMNNQKLSDLFRSKRGTAILAACIAETLHESDPTFRGRLLKRIEWAYRELKDNADHDAIEEMELLAWVSELLTGEALGGVPSKRFFEDY